MPDVASIDAYGWTAQPRDLDAFVGLRARDCTGPVLDSDILIPQTDLVTKVIMYAGTELPTETYHHCMRVYKFGMAIMLEQYPHWASETFTETFFIAALMHDIGTTHQNMSSTQLSFEIQGAFLALDLLKSFGAPLSQRESVCEAIIRHQDLGTTGKITTVGALVQLATILDNMGKYSDLVHEKTIRSINAEWPRMGWSGCFAATIRKENAMKPWAHTTHLGEEDFPEGVENNALMAPFDKEFVRLNIRS